jgi:transposase
VPMLEGNVDAVIGVDTHRDSHAAATLNHNGGLLARLQVPSSQAGDQQLLDLAVQHAPDRRCWALEGTGCYGAGLTSFLLAHGEWVVEVNRPKRGGRSAAKSDPLDAIRAAAKRWPVTSSPGHASVATGKRYGGCTLPAPAPSRSPQTPAAT